MRAHNKKERWGESSSLEKSDGVRVDQKKKRDAVRVDYDKNNKGVRVHQKKEQWGESSP